MKSLSRILAIGLVVAIACLAVVGSIALSGETTNGKKVPWSDATDILSQKYAAEAGRTIRKPIINTDQGNMLLFFFTLGGVGGGFAIGYYWRRLMTEKSGNETSS